MTFNETTSAHGSSPFASAKIGSTPASSQARKRLRPSRDRQPFADQPDDRFAALAPLGGVELALAGQGPAEDAEVVALAAIEKSLFANNLSAPRPSDRSLTQQLPDPRLDPALGAAHGVAPSA